MRKFDVNKLTQRCKSMYKSQLSWAEKNWKDTLKLHANKDIEKLLQQIEIYDAWKKALNDYGKISQELLPEIFMDSYMSIHFACMGLYKQANVCLRAQLETALRLIYFASHPVEFGWWSGGKDEYFRKRDIWADDYQYFRRLSEIQMFQRKYKETGASYDIFNRVRSLYAKLSQYVHSSISSFQTKPKQFVPTYNKVEFNKWLKAFKETEKLISILLMLVFKKEFKTLGLQDQKNILKVAQEPNLKKILRQTLGLKFRGRI